MDTQTFWTTVGLIATALIITTPLAHRALGGPPQQRVALRVTGALAALSFTLDAGVVAAAMTVPWLCLGVVLALHELRTIGLVRLLRCPNAAVLGPLATWAWMAAGATWLTAHRLGLEPLGFDRAITLLTVAHFNVAGLGLTALLAVTYRRRPGTMLLAAIWLHQAGMLTVAAGLTFNDHLEVAGAAAITVALAVWAVIVVGWVRDGLQGPARVLLVVAAVAWILPMALALGWALGPFLPEPVVTTFITMLRYHAALQTFGLVLCGLAGVVLSEPATDSPPPAVAPITNTTTEAHDDVAHQTRA
jgi:hypothetical protein